MTGVERAPGAGQIGFEELTGVAGLSEDESPSHDADPTASRSSAKSHRSSSPARRCMAWRSATTCRGNRIRLWVQKYEAGAFDEDATAVDIIQEYEAGSRWSGLSATGARGSSFSVVSEGVIASA